MRHLHLLLRVLGIASLLTIPSIAWAWTPFWVNGYCRQSGGYCRATLGNAGGAEACCDPLSAEVQTCARSNPCIGTHQQKWAANKFPLKWTFNANAMVGKSGYVSLDAAKVEEDIKRAWDYWTTPSCTSFKHEYTGVTKDPPDYFDGKITIYLATEKEWATLGQGAGGVLAFSVRRSSDKGQLLDGDILLNPQPLNKAWGTKPVPGDRFDLTMVMAHEIGHSIGFGHTPDQSTLMYFAIQKRGPALQPLGSDERSAICTTYPATSDCKQNDDCGPCHTCDGNLCRPANPAKSELCKACTEDKDCGNGGICTETAEGSRCMQPCQGRDCCPSGYRCETLNSRKLCVPSTGQCPPLTCKGDSDCGNKGVCRDGTCGTSDTYDTAACSRACQNSNDCGKNLTCHTFANDALRCVFACAQGHFCPEGYSCQAVAGGTKFCVPHSLYHCPCQSNADCAKGQSCKNKRCQTKEAGKEGELCNDEIPCGKGLRCISLGGGRCFRDCLKTPCPKGQTCQSYSINIKYCVGPKDKESGEVCDSITARCKLGLQCVQNTASITKGICVQPCRKKSECSDDDICTTNPKGQGYCGCSSDRDCETRGMTCKDQGKGYKMCVCEKPPCEAKLCGNLICDRKFGEGCESCPQDCICGKQQACSKNACVAEDKCTPEDKDPRCKRGCGCQSLDTATAPFPLLLLLVGLALARRRYAPRKHPTN